jgi:hypothetical protein
VNDIEQRKTTGQTLGDARPALPKYLSADAEVHSEELSSFVDAGNRAHWLVYGWLTPRIEVNAVEAFSLAARDFVFWFAAHGGRAPLRVTIGWEDPRVLITLQDHGAELPDVHRSRRDVAMIHRALGHYVTEWECDLNAAGARVARIYGDITASKEADPEEWPQ